MPTIEIRTQEQRLAFRNWIRQNIEKKRGECLETREFYVSYLIDGETMKVRDEGDPFYAEKSAEVTKKQLKRIRKELKGIFERSDIIDLD